MKKIGLLLVATIFLSGCSTTNGMLSKEDVINAAKSDSKEIIEKQKEVSYIPEDVKEFLEKSREANEDTSGQSNSYLNIRLDDASHMDNGRFLNEIYMTDSIENPLDEELSKFIDILDETIAKGIKLYLDKNINANIKESGISTRIGRAWVFINPIKYEYEGGSYPESTIDSEDNSGIEFAKNEVTIIMKLRDIKDPDYKKIVESIQGEDFLINSINIGRNQDLIRLNNMESMKNNGYSDSDSGIRYQLLMKDKMIDKVKMSVIGLGNEKIKDDLQSLTRVSNALGFDIEDTKKLEELKVLIKENKVGKKTLNSKNFNFSYKNLESDRSAYGVPKKINTAEIIIEKRR